MLEHRRDARLRTAGQRADPRDQHGERERLGQVVVGAEPEPVDQILILRRAGQHQHPAAAAGGDEPRAHLIAMDGRQVAIEHDHVVIVDQRARQARLAVQRDIDRHPRLAQAGGDRLGQFLVVLDHKHPHRPLLLRCKVAAGVFHGGFTGCGAQTAAGREEETGRKPPVA